MIRLNDSRGFTLLEIMAAAGLLGVVAVGVMQLTQVFSTRAKVEAEFTGVYRSLAEIEKDLLKDDAYIPPIDNPTGMTFNSPTGVASLCYDQGGRQLPGVAFGAANCYFQVKAYKVPVRDRTFASLVPGIPHPLSRIPLSRYKIQVTYTLENTPHTIELSRLVTNVLHQ